MKAFVLDGHIFNCRLRSIFRKISHRRRNLHARSKMLLHMTVSYRLSHKSKCKNTDYHRYQGADNTDKCISRGTNNTDCLTHV